MDNNFPGTSTLGAVQAYYADAPTLGAVDLAAAYMFATNEIVHGDDDLPPDFVDVFFTAEELFTTHEDYISWSETPGPERDRLTGLALRGMTRAITAFGVSVPALLERMLYVLLTVNVAMLALSLI